ncbi:MAG: TldD/PmbA family protein [Acidobacteriota bacterium]
MMVNQDLLIKIHANLLRDGGELADIFHEWREDFRLTLSSERGLLPSYGTMEGAALRLIKDGRCSNIHLELPEEKDLIEASNSIREYASARTGSISLGSDPEKKKSGDAGGEGSNDAGVRSEKAMELAARIHPIVLMAESLLRENFEDCFSYMISASFYRQQVRIISYRGEFVEDSRKAALFRMSVLARSGDDRIFSEASESFSAPESLIERIDPGRLCQNLKEKWLNKKDSINAPQGQTPLVLAPGAGGVLIHEAAGHLFEADNPLVASRFDKFHGQDFGEHLSIHDDPACMERGNYRFDDEGMEGKKKSIIDRGRFLNLLHSLTTSRKRNEEPSGNGRRQSFRETPLPRMSAIYVDPGKMDPESILKRTRKGIYGKRFGDAYLDGSSGKFCIHLTEGYTIENGKTVSPIKRALVYGNAVDILRSIDLIGSDLTFDITGLVCTKGGQALPTTVGTPTIRIASVQLYPA